MTHKKGSGQKQNQNNKCGSEILLHPENFTAALQKVTSVPCKCKCGTLKETQVSWLHEKTNQNQKQQ